MRASASAALLPTGDRRRVGACKVAAMPTALEGA